MNIEYRTRIDLIDYRDDPDLGRVATSIRWQLTGIDVDTGHMTTTYVITGLSDPDPAQFTAWDSLTEAVGLDWITAAMPADELAARKATVAQELERAQQAPLAPVPPPWAFLD